MLKRTIARAIALAMILAASVSGAYAVTGDPAQIAPDAACLKYLSFYPGQWHAHATAHSWIFSLGRMHVVCARTN